MTDQWFARTDSQAFNDCLDCSQLSCSSSGVSLSQSYQSLDESDTKQQRRGVIILDDGSEPLAADSKPRRNAGRTSHGIHTQQELLEKLKRLYGLTSVFTW